MCVLLNSAPQLCPSFFALPAVFLMKGKDALAYCRQLLFEQRLISAWESASRISIVAAFVAWQLYPKHEMSGTARLEAERERWRQEVEYERATSLERNRRDQRQIEQVQARLDASEGVVAQLRSDNQALQEELASVLQKLDLGGELEQLRVEREQRAAADAKAAVQEAALRSRLEAEQKRLAEGSAQLASLEAIAEENQATLRQRQTNEEREGRSARDEVLAAFRAAREANGGSIADGAGSRAGRLARRLAWRAALAQSKLRLTWRRHDEELEAVEEKFTMLDGLRESRDALEWRVTQTKAQLIVLRSAAEGTHGASRSVDAAFGLRGDENMPMGRRGRAIAGDAAAATAVTAATKLSSPKAKKVALAPAPSQPSTRDLPLSSMPPPNYPPPGFTGPPPGQQQASRGMPMVPSPSAAYVARARAMHQSPGN